MLVTSIFSFSHNVFKTLLYQGRLKLGLYCKQLNMIEYVPVCVFTSHSLEPSLSYSPDFSIIRRIWMSHNFWLAKQYDSANQKLFYIPICKSWRKGQGMFLRMVGEYEPWSLPIYTARVAQWWACRNHDLVVVSSIPGWGDFSFRRIFASHLCRSMWEK